MSERKTPQQPPSMDPEKVKELFQQFDVNKDGRVDVTELTEGLCRLGVPTIPGQAEVSTIHTRSLIVLILI